MQKGYIQARDSVFWDSRLHKVAALRGLSENAVDLTARDDTEGIFSGSYAVAYRCPKCREVVIRY